MVYNELYNLYEEYFGVLPVAYSWINYVGLLLFIFIGVYLLWGVVKW